jgi:ABC-type lipoprotein release transport system permease subunit
LFFVIFIKYWLVELYQLSLGSQELITSNSVKIIKNNSLITASEFQELENILGKYNSQIKKVFYRTEFAGLAKHNEFEASFHGFGIDLKGGDETLSTFLTIEKGKNLLTSGKSSVIISRAMAEKLNVNLNDNIEIFVLNRDVEIGENEIINIASLKINGIFNEKFDHRNYLFLPIKLSDFILKSAKVNSVIVEFYTQEDLEKLKNELKENLAKFDMKFYKIPKVKNINSIIRIINNLFNIVMIIAVFIAIRDSLLLLEKRQNNNRVLLAQGWTKMKILKMNIFEITIFNIFSWIFISLIISLIFFINFGYPVIFTDLDFNIYLNVEISDILFYTSALFLLNWLVQTIVFFFKK